MDILYVTSEAAPFCKTGGLADVLGVSRRRWLPVGDRAAVILPLYGQVSDAWRENALARLYLCGPGVAA